MNSYMNKNKGHPLSINKEVFAAKIEKQAETGTPSTSAATTKNVQG